MTEKDYYTKPTLIDDLSELNDTATIASIKSSAKNLGRLKDLPINALWVIGPNDKELARILSYVHPKYLNIYQLLAKDLSPFEQLSETEAIILNWNTKATHLWDLGKNNSLTDLHIEDFSKLQSITEISRAKHLRNLTLEGGIWKPLRISSLKPISELTHLEYLKLASLKVDDDSLKPLASLKNLKALDITNQFETSEYAWLTSRIPKTKCSMFHAFVPCHIPSNNGDIESDVMIVGRRKPFLHSIRDKQKINKYVEEYKRLVEGLKE